MLPKANISARRRYAFLTTTMVAYLANEIANFFFDILNLDVNLQLLWSRWLDTTHTHALIL